MNCGLAADNGVRPWTTRAPVDGVDKYVDLSTAVSEEYSCALRAVPAVPRTMKKRTD